MKCDGQLLLLLRGGFTYIRAVVVGGCERDGVHLLAELIHAQHVTKIQRGNGGVLEDEAMEASGSGSGAVGQEK